MAAATLGQAPDPGRAPDTLDTGAIQKKRARLVCFRCHEKKIKCDLLKQTGPNYGPCHNCTLAEATCQLRPSRRGASKRQTAANRQNVARTTTSTGRGEEGDATLFGAAQPSNVHEFNSDTYLPASHGVLDSSLLVQNNPRGSFPPLEQPTENLNPSAAVAELPQFIQTNTFTPPNSSQPHVTPGANSTTSQVRAQPSYFSNAGYMQLLSNEEVNETDEPQTLQVASEKSDLNSISTALQTSFLETYFDYCFYWCPVIDTEMVQFQDEGIESPLLRQALALCGTRINPPLIQFTEAGVYYNRSKDLFYAGCEGNALVRISAIMLFFWWSTGAANMVNMDNAWWWTGIAIRIAQESGLHREPQPHQLTRPGETVGLRRRIWWTLFARDRILSISQGRPTVIDPDFCDIKMVTPEDFPEPNNFKVHIFINWLKLLTIAGEISKQLSRKAEDHPGTRQFSQDLVSWIQSLPDTLSLHIRSARTTTFDRDVHRLYLTYLTTVQLLHMNKSSQLLPVASTAAIIAASCVARIFMDYLARGNIRFLSGEAGWEIAVALLALLHACRTNSLREHARADIRTLRIALSLLAEQWPSSRMFSTVFDKLLGTNHNSISLVQTPAELIESLGGVQGREGNGDSELMDYFPFVTSQTSPLIDAVLTRDLVMSFDAYDWPMDINATLQDFLALPEDDSFDIFNC